MSVTNFVSFIARFRARSRSRSRRTRLLTARAFPTVYGSRCSPHSDSQTNADGNRQYFSRHGTGRRSGALDRAFPVVRRGLPGVCNTSARPCQGGGRGRGAGAVRAEAGRYSTSGRRFPQSGPPDRQSYIAVRFTSCSDRRIWHTEAEHEHVNAY